MAEIYDERPMLRTNLVPRTAWARNYKPKCPSNLWKALFEHYLEEYGHACAYCHWSPSLDDDKIEQLVLHQEWRVETDHQTRPKQGTMVFDRFEIVCWDCHDVKHAGWAGIENRPVGLQLATVSGWNEGEVVQHVEESTKAWRSHSGLRSWNYDLASWNNNPIVQQFLQKNPQTNIKFGSLCLLRSGNLNQHPASN